MAGERKFDQGVKVYKTAMADQVQTLVAELGANNRQVAEVLGVTPQTVERWKEKIPEFGEAFKEAEKIANEKVKQALYKRCLGFERKATKIMQYQGEIVEADYMEYYPPDVQACLEWLKKRDPENWRDITRQEITGADGAPIPVINISLHGMLQAPEPPAIDITPKDPDASNS